MGGGSAVEPDSSLSAAGTDDSASRFGSKGVEFDVDSVGRVKARVGVSAGPVSSRHGPGQLRGDVQQIYCYG